MGLLGSRTEYIYDPNGPFKKVEKDVTFRERKFRFELVIYKLLGQLDNYISQLIATISVLDLTERQSFFNDLLYAIESLNIDYYEKSSLIQQANTLIAPFIRQGVIEG